MSSQFMRPPKSAMRKYNGFAYLPICIACINNGTFFQAAAGLCNELYQKIGSKIRNHVALIISLNDLFKKILTAYFNF